MNIISSIIILKNGIWVFHNYMYPKGLYVSVILASQRAFHIGFTLYILQSFHMHLSEHSAVYIVRVLTSGCIILPTISFFVLGSR